VENLRKIRARTVEKGERNFIQFCKMQEDHQVIYLARI